MSATTTAALLQSVLDNPSDDGVRLAYADAMEEAGELDRAEFIRVQVELAPYADRNLVGDVGLAGRIDSLRRRERELLDCGHAWMHAPPPLRPSNRWARRNDGLAWLSEPTIGWAFRRGFVARVECSADDWLRHADAITIAHPVEQVRLTTWQVPHWRSYAESGLIFRLGGRTTWHRDCDLIRTDEDERKSWAELLLAAEWPKITFHFPS